LLASNQSVQMKFSIFGIMTASQYSVFYDDFGKFREPSVEGLLKSDSEGANENLPFFVCQVEYF